MQHQDQDRMDQLATQVRRLRWMNYGMAVVIAAGVMLAAGALQQASPLVKAKRIEIVADDGKTVLTLGSDFAGGLVELFNASGGKVAVLESSSPFAGRGMLATYNGRGQALVTLAATRDGEGVLSTYNNGKELLRLGALLGSGVLTAFNDRGNKHVELAAGIFGGSVHCYNDKGRALVTLEASIDDNGRLATYNGKGKKTSTLP